jgi:hypothetical protein
MIDREPALARRPGAIPEQRAGLATGRWAFDIGARSTPAAVAELVAATRR